MAARTYRRLNQLPFAIYVNDERPVASAVPDGTVIFNSSSNALEISKGDRWWVAGSPS